MPRVGSCLSGSRDESQGELALPLLPLPGGRKTGTATLTLTSQFWVPPRMPQQFQEFPGWFLQGSDMKKRDTNLITSRHCLRQGCCQSQLPRLPIPASPHPCVTEGSWACRMHPPLRPSFPCLAAPTFRSSLSIWFSQGLLPCSGLRPWKALNGLNFSHGIVHNVFLPLGRQLMEKPKYSSFPRAAPPLQNKMCSY